MLAACAPTDSIAWRSCCCGLEGAWARQQLRASRRGPRGAHGLPLLLHVLLLPFLLLHGRLLPRALPILWLHGRLLPKVLTLLLLHGRLPRALLPLWLPSWTMLLLLRQKARPKDWACGGGCLQRRGSWGSNACWLQQTCCCIWQQRCSLQCWSGGRHICRRQGCCCRAL